MLHDDLWCLASKKRSLCSLAQSETQSRCDSGETLEEYNMCTGGEGGGGARSVKQTVGAQQETRERERGQLGERRRVVGGVSKHVLAVQATAAMARLG